MQYLTALDRHERKKIYSSILTDKCILSESTFIRKNIKYAYILHCTEMFSFFFQNLAFRIWSTCCFTVWIRLIFYTDTRLYLTCHFFSFFKILLWKLLNYRNYSASLGVKKVHLCYGFSVYVVKLIKPFMSLIISFSRYIVALDVFIIKLRIIDN